MRILITGGTGTISYEASRLALSRGWDLTIVNPRGIDDLGLLGARWIQADYHDPDALAKAVYGMSFDVVVDFLCYNRDQAENIFAIFRDKTKQLIHISTATVYSRPPDPPIVTEDAPLANPYWEYAQRKIECELYYRERYQKDGFPVTIVRPSQTYGRRIFPVALAGTSACWTYLHMMKHGIPMVVHGDGNLLWTITHSEDFAVGLCGLFAREESIGQAFHITSDECMRWDDIIQVTAASLGVRAEIVHVPTEVIVEKIPFYRGPLLGDKAWDMRFDNSKIKSIVPEFKPAIPYRIGIQKVIDYLSKHPELQVVDEAYLSSISSLY
ncbi:MAG: NAD-dependent epimerase/dehydratase family protein [Clostridiales bacterium]|nr:NAD-dependent epimerase/dehydratase family protein [Clostridiales bacterium]